MALLFANSFRSALLVRLAGIPRRVGYDREGRGMLLTDRLLPYKFDGKYVPSPMLGYYNAIARYVGCHHCPQGTELYTTADQESVAADAVEAAGVSADQPIVVINPGASFGRAKCWLPERFAEVGDRLACEHQAAIFIACGPKEVSVARRVAGLMTQPATVLDSPVMRLGPLKALIRRASLLITNDTGPRHFANALNRPVVTVFGPTDPQWTTTPAPAERSVGVPVDCGPCMKRDCPKDHRCMTGVEPGMVLTAARELLVSSFGGDRTDSNESVSQSCDPGLA
jgi:heptosyltransferase-2